MSTLTKENLKEGTIYPATLERKFSPAEVEKDYSHVAWMYDMWARLTESRAVNKSLQLASIRDGESILEVAVGTGTTFKKIVERNKNGRNDGIDISQSMLSIATKRMKKCNVSNYRLQVGNAYALPYGDCEFDLIINNYMLDLLPEPDFVSILKEFNRVLKSPGRVVIVSMAYGRRWHNHLWYWIAKHFPSLLTNCRPISVEKYMGDAGFKEIKIE
ncbi:MAG: methyltransferase domain-containing protein, partial [Thaumarchaeota archaeon]|nr:methyltransferase domain-containing protein [Nitrososphaerota archaeon]